MKPIHASALAAKVAAVNAANAEAKRLYPLLVAAFAPLYGQKVIKATGGLLESVRSLIPALPTYATTGNRLNAFVRTSGDYSLVCEVTASELYEYPGSHSSQYHTVLLYFCDLSGQLAKAPTGGGDWVLKARTDYTAAEVAALRETHRKAKEAASAALSALHEFGEYDR